MKDKEKNITEETFLKAVSERAQSIIRQMDLSANRTMQTPCQMMLQ